LSGALRDQPIFSGAARRSPAEEELKSQRDILQSYRREWVNSGVKIFHGFTKY